MPSLWEVLKTSKGLPAPDGFTALFARSLSDTYTLAEISGIPPLNLGEVVEIVDYTIYGNTYQADGVTPDTPQEVIGVGERTGNLYQFPYTEYLNLSGSGDNRTVVNNNSLMSNIVNLNPNTTYCLSGNRSEFSDNYGRIALFSEYPTVGVVSTHFYSFKNQNSVSFTTTADEKYALVLSTSGYDEDGEMMLNSGETPLPYEPYGYKIPVVSRGKNLFDKNDCTVAGFITSSGSIAGAAQWYTVQNYIKCSGAITLSTSDGLGTGAYITCYDVNKILLGTVAISETNETIETLNLKDGTIYIKVSARYTAFKDFQLELGTEATDYEPYVEPITTPLYLDSPLYKIGDYSDSRGRTEEVRAVKELVLTGTENYKILSESNAYGIITFFIEQTHFTPTDPPFGWCSHFPESNETYQTVKNESFGLINKDRIYIRVSNNRIKTKEELAQWIKEQYEAGTPVTVYYVLATPETETVDAVEISTLDGTTVIDVDTEVKPSNLKITYKSRR